MLKNWVRQMFFCERAIEVWRSAGFVARARVSIDSVVRDISVRKKMMFMGFCFERLGWCWRW